MGVRAQERCVLRLAVRPGHQENLEALLWDGYYKGPDYTEYPVTHIFYQADKYEETINFTFYQGSGVGDVYGNAVLVPALYETIAIWAARSAGARRASVWFATATAR